MKQAAFLQKAKSGLPLGNPGPEHLPKPRLVPGWSQSPHTPPVLPQGRLMFSLGQMHLDLTAVKACLLNPTSPDTPPGGPSPSTALGRGVPQLHNPLKLQAQTFLPGLQVALVPFCNPLPSTCLPTPTSKPLQGLRSLPRHEVSGAAPAVPLTPRPSTGDSSLDEPRISLTRGCWCNKSSFPRLSCGGPAPKA